MLCSVVVMEDKRLVKLAKCDECYEGRKEFPPMVKDQIQTGHKCLTVTKVRRGIFYASVQLCFMLDMLVCIADVIV